MTADLSIVKMYQKRLLPNYLSVLYIVVSSMETTPVGAVTCSQLCHYVPWARDADCSGRRLQQIPLECVGSKALNLNKNNISELQSRIFSPFEHLKYLQILGSRVQTVQANSFAGAERLKSINLMFNYLTLIPEHSFNDTPSLKWVYLTGNRIGTIETGVFQEAPQIEMLYLDDNQLDHLDEGVLQGLSKLQRLLLGGNNLREISGNHFRGVAGLNYIDLSRNQLRSLSKDTFHGMRHLKTINLASNGLISIAAGTFSFSDVSYLNISSNKLTTFGLEKHELAFLIGVNATGNRWNCDCSLDPFRETLQRISHPGFMCEQPNSRANTNITSYSSLCSSPTPIIPDKTKKSQKSFQVGYDADLDDRDVEKVSTAGRVPPETITLIVVLAITAVALIVIGIFLTLFLLFPLFQKKRNKKTDMTKEEKIKPQDV